MFKFSFYKIINLLLTILINLKLIKKVKSDYEFISCRIPNHHVFVGYYDINPINNDDKYLLCLKVNEQNKATVGYFHIDQKKNH